ncbi:MAG: DUF2332 domain-containing protein [Novosphingobium sp.]|nr:DUF2332 domain-containing protein [Novosphingobium sp.]
MAADAEDLEHTAAAYRAAEHMYGTLGSPLYATLCREGAKDPEVLALSAEGLDAASPVHLFTSAHFLLLGGAKHPLARFFATLVAEPAPPDEAWPDFRAFCLEYRDELRQLIASKPVQMTYAYRCRTLLPPMCIVADEAGEPLNIVELGCSAGALLMFDKYAYELREGEHIGDRASPIHLKGELHGGPALRIPLIGSRTGLDLNVIDPNREEDRRWMIATCYPELLDDQRQLNDAMDFVAASDIAFHEGDALTILPGVLAATPDPVCVYHSACLFYWNEEQKDELERQLREASMGRVIHRISVETTSEANRWLEGRNEAMGEAGNEAQATGEIILTRYRDGKAEPEWLAASTPDFGTMWWKD